MTEIQSNEAQRNFKDVLDSVEHRGETVSILRYKATAAVVVPADWHARAEKAMTTLGEVHAIIAAFDWERDDRQYALEAIEALVTSV
jgi:antitoxin (DNA-binding transcriptional repressor) of toxin-antitoxin stability system